MTDSFDSLKSALDSRFSWINDIKTMFQSIEMSDSTGGIQSLKCNLPIVGNVTVVDFTFLNNHAAFIRGLCSAFVYFLIAIYVFREAPKLLGLMS